MFLDHILALASFVKYCQFIMQKSLYIYIYIFFSYTTVHCIKILYRLVYIVFYRALLKYTFSLLGFKL